MFQPSGNKAFSLATLPPTNRYSKRIGVSSAIGGNKRSEGKRETSDTHSKMSLLHDKMSQSPKKKEDERLTKETKWKQRRPSTEYLKGHVNKIKDLQMRLTRLTRSTLNQYECVRSSSTSSHPSPVSPRERILNSPYNKAQIRGNSKKIYTFQHLFPENLKSDKQEVSNDNNIGKKATQKTKLANLSDPTNTDASKNDGNSYNLAKQRPSQFYPFHTLPLDSPATTDSSQSTPSSPEDIKQHGIKILDG